MTRPGIRNIYAKLEIRSRVELTRAWFASSYAHRAGQGEGHLQSILTDHTQRVERHRDAFRELVERHVDILFANEAEIRSLYKATEFDAALQQVRPIAEIADQQQRRPRLAADEQGYRARRVRAWAASMSRRP